MSQTERVEIGKEKLAGELTLAGVRGLVLFSPDTVRDHCASDIVEFGRHIVDGGFGTLLFDVLSDRDRHDRTKVFDVRLAAAHLVEAIEWARTDARTAQLPLFILAENTGAAWAMVAAEGRADIAGIISISGRFDLSSGDLSRVYTPTLLIVDDQDEVTLTINRNAQADIGAHCSLKCIAKATWPVGEVATLDTIAKAALAFLRDLSSGHSAVGRGLGGTSSH